MFDSVLPAEPLDYLKEELRSRQSRRPEYSLRAFARDLNLSPSTLSELINGKVGLSTSKAEYLAKRLKLDSPHNDHFCDLIAARYSRSQKTRDEASSRASARLRSKEMKLSLDKYSVIAEWQHFAILELVDLNPKYHKVTAIAKALKLPRELAESSIERLVRVGELEVTAKVWKTKTAITYAGEETPSTAIKTHHLQVLRKATEAVFDQTLDERELQTSFFCIDDKDLPSLKADLNKMRKEIIKKYGYKTTKNTVYAFALQLFRISERT